MLKQHMSRSALLLGLFALVGTGLVAVIFTGTEESIELAQQEYMLRSLHSVIKPELHDNDIFSDYIEVVSKEYLGTDKPVSVFRARKNNQPVALAITTVTNEGYVGPIKLLVGIDINGTVIGVRVINHRETPGLGDAIDEKRSNWIFGFNDHSLKNPETEGWRVRKDGGVFDQFTGATITPRAVVKAVYNTLKYFEKNRERLFTEKSLIREDRSSA